ncbi:MAG: LUD domain-containing protein [Flavobacteriales bacterium]|nr:LUD domain-containing protein [Flavobacteriales bacterium]
MERTSKEKVLKKVRKALIDQSPELFPGLDFTKNIYNLPDDSDQGLDIAFAAQFTANDGKFIFCEDATAFVSAFAAIAKENNWKNIHTLEPTVQALLKKVGIAYTSLDSEMEQMDAGITYCEFLIARSGSIMLSSRQVSGRRMAAYPPAHIVIGYANQLVMHVQEALNGVKKRYASLPSLITTITGPSRTADIEKTLILGAHGPKELYVFLLDKDISE